MLSRTFFCSLWEEEMNLKKGRDVFQVRSRYIKMQNVCICHLQAKAYERRLAQIRASQRN